MKVSSVNLAEPSRLPGLRPLTGIAKRPVMHAVEITAQGLVGDSVCNIRHHGGVDQAVYIYGESDYAWWSDRLGRKLEPGTFGENLTISALHSAERNIGDRLHIGAVVLEVTAPRIPCGTLARRMRDRSFPEQFREAEHPGLYCRVIQPGVVQVGMPVALEPHAGPAFSLVEMFRSFYRDDEDEAELLRQLAAPIAIRARRHKERQLQKLRKS